MRDNTAQRLPVSPEPLEPARVLARTEQGYLTQSGSGLATVQAAFSCLVVPEPQDLVLVAWHPGGGAIIAVLERPGAQAMNLGFPADTTLTAQGSLQLRALTTLGLSAGQRAELASPELGLSTQRAKVFADQVEAVGRFWQLRTQRLSVIAETLQSLAQTLLQRFKSSIRIVEGVDQHTVGDSLQVVRSTLAVRAHNAVISAREDVKIDGERIHMG